MPRRHIAPGVYALIAAVAGSAVAAGAEARSCEFEIPLGAFAATEASIWADAREGFVARSEFGADGVEPVSLYAVTRSGTSRSLARLTALGEDGFGPVIAGDASTVVTLWSRHLVPVWPDWRSGVVVDLATYDRWTGSVVRVQEAFSDLRVRDLAMVEGRFVAVLTTWRQSPATVYLASSSDGAEWILHDALDEKAADLDDPQLGCDGTDLLCLYRNRLSESVLYRWSPAQPSAQLVHAFGPDGVRPTVLAVRGLEVIGAALDSEPEELIDRRVAIVASGDGGDTWGSPVWLPADSLASVDVAIAPDASWRVLVTRLRRDGTDTRYTPVLYSSADRGIVWSSPDTLVCEGYLTDRQIDMVMCPDGGLYGVWCSQGRDYLGYASGSSRW